MKRNAKKRELKKGTAENLKAKHKVERKITQKKKQIGQILGHPELVIPTTVKTAIQPNACIAMTHTAILKKGKAGCVALCSRNGRTKNVQVLKRILKKSLFVICVSKNYCLYFVFEE